MLVKLFLKMFPVPKFLAMSYAGLDISDDAIHSIIYSSRFGHPYIKSFASTDLPSELMDGGDTKDRASLIKRISDFAKKSKLKYVKVSVPEEKAYLFEIDVPTLDIRSIRDNIESKLEENVPLAAPDALFYFDLLPPTHEQGSLRASVSVVPRTYIDHTNDLLRSAGLYPVAFEVVPKALARVVIPKDSKETVLIAHIMNRKTGIYIVSSGVVCFTSTLTMEVTMRGDIKSTLSRLSPADVLTQEIARIHEYWVSRPGAYSIDRVVLVGRDALTYEPTIGGAIVVSTSPQLSIPVSVPDIWKVVYDKPIHVPPIERGQSFAYAVAAGLALTS